MQSDWYVGMYTCRISHQTAPTAFGGRFPPAAAMSPHLQVSNVGYVEHCNRLDPYVQIAASSWAAPQGNGSEPWIPGSQRRRTSAGQWRWHKLAAVTTWPTPAAGGLASLQLLSRYPTHPLLPCLHPALSHCAALNNRALAARDLCCQQQCIPLAHT
jgi:hypothetical protein